jgi:hypothetical protein
MSNTDNDTQKPRKKYNYIGAPACFALDLALRHINEAFEGECYVVGSVLERPDWRDVDVRMIMDDEDFAKNFPDVVANRWENDAKNSTTGQPGGGGFQQWTMTREWHKLWKLLKTRKWATASTKCTAFGCSSLW